jgi:hypothetical protein
LPDTGAFTQDAQSSLTELSARKRITEPEQHLKQMPKESFARLFAAHTAFRANCRRHPAFHHPFTAPWWLTARQVNEKDGNVNVRPPKFQARSRLTSSALLPFSALVGLPVCQVEAA